MISMPTSFIIGIDYATRVRNRLGVTDIDLTTAEIDEFLEEVEWSVADRITTYATLAGKDLVYLKAGTVYALAARMCPLLKAKMPKIEKGLNTSVESGEDWDTKEQKMINGMNEQLSKITGYTANYVVTPTFALSGPSRSGNDIFS
jgi:hypothetical protein